MEEEIRQILNEIILTLAAMSKKDRLAWFKQKQYVQPLAFRSDIDGTVYMVRSLFREDAAESITEKVERILDKQTARTIEEKRQI